MKKVSCPNRDVKVKGRQSTRLQLRSGQPWWFKARFAEPVTLGTQQAMMGLASFQTRKNRR
jgi:hypothetical protein